MSLEVTDSQPDGLMLPAGDSSVTAPSSRQFWILAALLFVITLLLYGRSIRFEFVAYDDYRYIVDNPQIRRGLTSSTIEWALTHVFFTNYSPVLILTELTVSTLFGTGPAAFHAANVLLHAANVVLAFALLRRLGGGIWVSCIAAAVWGWHPLRVESVAWVAELKDVLCGFFWLVTMLAYLPYTRRPTVARYSLVLLAFVAALASKPMAVTLPFVLLLIDIFPLQRFSLFGRSRWRNGSFLAIAEKLPMIVLSAVWSHITVSSQIDALASFPVRVRLANAVVSTADYLRDMLVPRRLAVFYPHPSYINHTIPASYIILSAVALILLSAGCVMLAVHRRPAALIGWLWFLGALVPVLGLVQANQQARADRNTYIPMLGLTAATVWMASATISGQCCPRPTKVMAALAVVVILVGEIVTTERQLGTWQTSETLFQNAVNVTEDNYLAYGELANIRIMDGRAAEALALVDRSLQILPSSKYGLVTRGLALTRLNRYAEAQHAFRQAIILAPKDGDLRHKEALLLVLRKRYPEAEQQFKRSIELNGDNAVTHNDYAALFSRENRLPEAKVEWRLALQLDPNFADAHAGLAHTAHLEGDVPTAIAEYHAAIRTANPPVRPDWLLDLAWLEATAPGSSAREVDDAVSRATAAIADVNAASPLALDTLAAALARAGQFDRAVSVATSAVSAARAAGDTGLLEAIHQRLLGYQRGDAYIIRRSRPEPKGPTDASQSKG